MQTHERAELGSRGAMNTWSAWAARPVTARELAFAVLVTLALLLAWHLRHLLLLVFGAVLVAALLRAITGWLVHRTPVGERVGLAVAIVGVAALLATLSWLAGAQFHAQLAELSERLPQAWSRATEWFAAAAGGPLSDWLRDSAPSGARVLSSVGTAAATFVGALASAALVAVGGVYFAAQPRVYRRGLLRPFPPARREQYGRAYDRLGTAVQRWLVMQLLAMIAVGVVTGLGLWWLGVPTPLALGVLAGLLEFVPVAGPILAAIPALLVVLGSDPALVPWVALLYVAIQQIEGNVLTPLLAERVVAVPPALMLFALVAFASLFGATGALLAAPLLVVAFVAVREFYVEHALEGRPIEAHGESP